MNIAIFSPNDQPFSYKKMVENLVPFFLKYGIQISFFKHNDNIPRNADIIWDPNVGGGYISKILSTNKNIPLIITFHGARLFSLNLNLLISERLKFHKAIYHRYLQKRLWKKHLPHIKKIVTISDYSSYEGKKYLNFKSEKIERIYNSVNQDIFFPTKNAKNYFLHISEYQPVKNVDRIIEAYILAAKQKKDIPDLWIVCRNYPKKSMHPKIKILNEKKRTDMEMAKLYQNAFAFLFPSLHEGFGIPIIEAMACGCPVITSNITACPEIANNSAILVNPRSKENIKDAIISLCDNDKLYQELSDKGIERASFFTPQKAAKHYIEIFKNIIHV